jgi:hypothetical protein
MRMTLALILMVLWLMGLVAPYMGAFIHVLPVVAILLVVVRIIQGRRWM